MLQFRCPELPNTVQVGYLYFNVKQYIPQPLRCFKCNRFGHVAANCRNKERCAKCGNDNKTISCNIDVLRCVNCNGNHSATSKECPRYINEAQVLKVKVEKKITYAEACKQCANISSNNGTSAGYPTWQDAKQFPALPRGNGASPVATRHIPAIQEQPCNESLPSQEEHQVQSQTMDKVDFANNFMFGTPVYFVAFLAEVISLTLGAKDKTKTIDIYNVISQSVGKHLGIPIEPEQLKSMI